MHILISVSALTVLSHKTHKANASASLKCMLTTTSVNLEPDFVYLVVLSTFIVVCNLLKTNQWTATLRVLFFFFFLQEKCGHCLFFKIALQRLRMAITFYSKWISVRNSTARAWPLWSLRYTASFSYYIWCDFWIAALQVLEFGSSDVLDT